MSQTPQFYEMPSRQNSDWAIYEFPSGNSASSSTIVVECVAGRGGLPRDAAVLAGFRASDLIREFTVIADMAKSALVSMRGIGAAEGEIEFGVELGGEMGVPLITKGDARANFKVTLRWKDDPKEA